MMTQGSMLSAMLAKAEQDMKALDRVLWMLEVYAMSPYSENQRKDYESAMSTLQGILESKVRFASQCEGELAKLAQQSAERLVITHGRCEHGTIMLPCRSCKEDAQG